ncbi:ABC transporter substrate-binding protein [Acidipropionibacterium timonense]|uniref:ABC transporter substrate-binding protein n=1 Tax=Acidipropionibacterium timonense TaxID=2161818 RepID=UPI001030F95A|nr:sugar ABC transporter substrate-binding protein [Acidipropionibacterium timonense]
MKRRSFLAGAATLAAMAVTGCGSKSGGSSSTSSTIDAGTTAELTLAYWDKNQTPTIQENIKSFKAKYPKITIKTNLTAYANYWTKLKTQAQGGDLPDVLWMNGPNIQLYSSNDMLEPLDSVTSQGVSWDNYPKALVNLYTYDGKHYGIPKDYDTIGVFYNKAIFKQAGVEEPKAGWTWDDFHTKAKKISDWGRSKGIYGCATTINGDGQGTYYNTILQAGGFIIKDGKSGYDDPKSIEGLQCWADWIKDGSVASAKIVTDTKPDVMFENGKSAMFWAGDWTASELANDLKGKEDQFGVVELPRKDKQATVIHGLAWAVSKKSANKAAAIALAAHMSSKAAHEVEARNGTAIPAFNGTQDAWVKSYPKWDVKLFIDAATSYAQPYPVSKNTDVWANKEAEILVPAFDGQTTIAAAAKQMADFMNAALAKEK